MLLNKTSEVPNAHPFFVTALGINIGKPQLTSNQIHLFSVIFYNIADLQMKCVLPLMQISPNEHAFDSLPVDR